MSKIKDNLKIYFESDNLVVLDYIDKLEKHKNWPYGFTQKTKYYRRKLDDISEVIFHHTAGNTLDPPKGIEASNRYIITDPPKKPNGRYDYSRGRGWPRLPYHVYVPYHPQTWEEDKAWGEGRWVLYQCNPFEVVSWHTGSANKHGVGVVFQGNFSLKENGKKHPSDAQKQIAPLLWNEYLKPKLSLSNLDIRGHFDYTKKSCPGYWLEQFVRKTRNELDK